MLDHLFDFIDPICRVLRGIADIALVLALATAVGIGFAVMLGAW
jgi:hypothetical protein